MFGVLRSVLAKRVYVHGNSNRSLAALRKRWSIPPSIETVEIRLLLSSAPAISAPSSVTVVQGSQLSFTGANLIRVTDTGGSAEAISLFDSHGNLQFGNTSGLTIIGSNNSSSITLVGSLTAVNTALSTLKYVPTSNYSGPDTLTIVALDTATGLTSPATAISITVTASALPPSITAPGSATVTQGSTLPFTGTKLISVTDSSGSSEAMSLFVAHGNLKFGSTTGLTFLTANNSGAITITGALTAVNAGLTTLVYTPASGFTGADTLGLVVLNTSTGLSTPTKNVAITVNSNAAPPSVTAPTSAMVQQGNSLSFNGANTIVVADTAGSSDAVSLFVAHGTLQIANASGLTFFGSNNSSSFTIAGTLSAVNAGLATLTYKPMTGYSGLENLGLVALNSGNALTSPTKYVAITVTAPLTPPAVNAPSAVALSQAGTFSFTGGNTISVTDVSGSTEAVSLFVAHGSLQLNNTSGITFFGSNSSSSFTLVGSLGAINAGLASLKYIPVPSYAGADSLSLVALNTINGLTAPTVTTSITITAPLLPPVVTAPVSISLNQGQSFSFTGSNSVSITDTSGSAEALSLSVANGTLKFGSTIGLTFYGSNNSSAMTVVGSLSALNAALATLTYSPTNGFSGSDTLSLIDLDTSTGLTSTSKFTSITVKSIAPPKVIVPGSTAVNQGSVLSMSGANLISVTDAIGSTEAVSLAVSGGRLQLTSTSGLTIYGSNNSSAFTVVGSLSAINTALSGLTYTPNASFSGSDALTAVALNTITGLSSAVGKVTITVFAVPTGLKVVSYPPTSVTANVPFQVAVSVVDAGGSQYKGFSGSVTASLVSNTLGGSLGGTTTASIVNGVATFTNLSLSNGGNNYLILFSTPGLSSTYASSGFETHINVPSGVAQGFVNNIEIEYSNFGTVPIPAPLLIVTPGDSSSTTYFSLNSSILSAPELTGYSQNVQLLANGIQTVGTIYPGEIVTVPVYFRTSDPSPKFSLKSYTAANISPLNWSALPKPAPRGVLMSNC